MICSDGEACMEPKQCAYCRKLQRGESRVCSRCGHSFGRRKSRRGRSWPNAISHFSLPAASPHPGGHYSGLHAEDQPYESQIMPTPQHFIQEMREKEALGRQPKRNVVTAAHSTHDMNRSDDN